MRRLARAAVRLIVHFHIAQGALPRVCGGHVRGVSAGVRRAGWPVLARVVVLRVAREEVRDARRVRPAALALAFVRLPGRRTRAGPRHRRVRAGPVAGQVSGRRRGARGGGSSHGGGLLACPRRGDPQLLLLRGEAFMQLNLALMFTLPLSLALAQEPALKLGVAVLLLAVQVDARAHALVVVNAALVGRQGEVRGRRVRVRGRALRMRGRAAAVLGGQVMDVWTSGAGLATALARRAGTPTVHGMSNRQSIQARGLYLGSISRMKTRMTI